MMTTIPLSKRPRLSAAGLAVAAIAGVAFAQAPRPEAARAEAPKETRLERGKSLVEEVSRCQACHTPQLAAGSFDKANWMKGSTLVGIPAKPIEDWHQKAPDITSTSKLWANWKYEGFVAFLSTAKNPRGHKAGPPMPAYTLKAEDAEAMALYLKSLP
jgi:mono/diheme cytochrome c family protein